jgi:hypothetical protein
VCSCLFMCLVGVSGGGPGVYEAEVTLHCVTVRAVCVRPWCVRGPLSVHHPWPDANYAYTDGLPPGQAQLFLVRVVVGNPEDRQPDKCVGVCRRSVFGPPFGVSCCCVCF